MSVVPPEFGISPALYVRNGDHRRGIASPRLRDAFRPRVPGTCTNRPLSAARAGILFPFKACYLVLYHDFGLCQEGFSFFRLKNCQLNSVYFFFLL